MQDIQIITHKPPVYQHLQDTPEAAAGRLEYIEQVKQSFLKAIQAAADSSPWSIDKIAVSEAKGYVQDLIDDLFYKAAEEDRDTVEAADAQEAREQREHEAIERAFVRRF